MIQLARGSHIDRLQIEENHLCDYISHSPTKKNITMTGQTHTHTSNFPQLNIYRILIPHLNLNKESFSDLKTQ